MNLKKKPEAKLAIEYRVIGEIKPSAQNAMNHSPAQIDRIAKSIQMVGWTKPIVIDEKGEILAGHGTFQAAMQLGHVEVPTVTRSGLTSAQKRAYRIADNKIASQDWDSAILAGEFADLTKMGYDMGLTGFEPSEIEALLAPAPRELPDPAIPPIEKKAVSRPGDMWLMGEHRLICADSTKPATYKTLMAGRQAQCVFTDPPYGVSYQGLGLDSSKVDVIKGDEKRRGELLKMLREAFEAAMGHTRQDAGWYIWHASSTRADFSMAMIDVGLVEHSYLIWEKPGASMGCSDYRWAHEPCFYAARQGVKPAFHGDRTGTTVWRIEAARTNGEAINIGTGLIVIGPTGQEIYLTQSPPKGRKLRHAHLAKGAPLLLQPASDADDLWTVNRDEGSELHPTSKPVELARRALRNSTLEGELVLDMFAGAASTLIAAEQLKRIAYAIEIDPIYVDAGVKRWQSATGKQATHAKEKATYESIAKARHKVKG